MRIGDGLKGGKNIKAARGSFLTKKKIGWTRTYNSEDLLVVTHPTTNSPACGLCAVNSSVDVARARNG
ncbi:hypothetical protein ACN38_g1892 [Penicillium nordicum]|uniref:Uncharacterized protein n=1 Tax=Penicillium nordicum TaxID=229535 RepID=A0A0M8PEP7_9EURO|nr:hypothetical protein ACN38_g1892 [Penicillium nordicum]